MKYIENGRFGNLVTRIMKYLGLDDMDIEVNLKNKMCKLVLYKDRKPVMSGSIMLAHDAYDTEVIFKDFIDDWFINNNRSELLMSTIKGYSKNYLTSENYNELEMKLTLIGV